VKGEQLVGISALCETLAVNRLPREASDTGGSEGGEASHTEKIKKSSVRTYTSQKSEFRHAIKLPEERKAQQVFL